MRLKLITAPTEEPLTLSEVKEHIRVDVTDDDALITALIKAARERAEFITRRQLVTATWQLIGDSFAAGGKGFNLPLPSLQSVTKIEYVDTTGTLVTLSAMTYIVDNVSEPARVALAPDIINWPETERGFNKVLVTFDAGYGAASAIPEDIKLAMKLLIGSWYANREAAVVAQGISATELPTIVSAEALLQQFRVMRFS